MTPSGRLRLVLHSIGLFFFLKVGKIIIIIIIFKHNVNNKPSSIPFPCKLKNSLPDNTSLESSSVKQS